MQPREAAERLAPWRAAHRRTAWRPQVRRGVPVGPLGSKFGGSPWREPGTPWPACGLCWGPLNPVLQLNPADMPQEFRSGFGPELLQLFGCGRDCASDPVAGAREAFNRVSFVSLVPPGEEAKAAAPPREIGEGMGEAIVGWEKLDDYPRSLEHTELGLEYDYYWDHEAARVEWRDGGILLEWVEGLEAAEAICDARDGNKLGGWPAWERRVAYPTCVRCGDRMDLVFQLDSAGPLRLMGLHIGVGYITRCPRHKDVLAFTWQT